MVFFSFVSVLELYEDFFILKTNILFIVIVEVDKPCFFTKISLYDKVCRKAFNKQVKDSDEKIYT